MLRETAMLYKLTVLYLLKRTEFPLTNSQITNFILENDYTDYFSIQQNIGELIDDGYMVREETRGKTLYAITAEGIRTLDLLIDNISKDMRKSIDDYIRDNAINLLNDITVLSEYHEAHDGQFVAHMFINEDGKRIFDMSLTVPTEKDADAILSNWTKNNQEIYGLIVDKLFRGTT